MAPRANRDHKWMLLLIDVLLVVVFLPIVHAQEPNNIVNYPIQDYLSWSKVGEIPWTIDYTSGYNDKISLKSGPIECIGASILRMNNIHGPIIIRFKWKKDAGSGIGQLMFRVDENRTFECNSRDWTDFSYPLNADRSHILEWTFRKIKSYPLWAGAGWIDNVNFVRMDMQGNGEYVDRETSPSLASGDNNVSAVANLSANKGFVIPELGAQNLKSVENNGLGIEFKPNISIVIKEITYTPQNPSRINGKIPIKPISPKENETLSNESKLKFEYMLNDSSRVVNCTLIIDDQELAYSRKLKNGTNELILNKRLRDEGSHEWRIKCCECGSICNSSKSTYFRIANNNSTTYVNQSNRDDEARFIFPTIGQAIKKTDYFGKIIIEGGHYKENIIINKPLTIIGRNKPILHPAINGNSKTGIITIIQNDVEINGLVIKNSGYGIHIAGRTGKGMLKNIRIINNEISECGSEIFAEYCNDSNINNNIIYYSNKSGVCRTGIQLDYCNNLTLNYNKFNEAFRQPRGAVPMDACINMLSCDEKTIRQIKHNTFDYSNKGVNIRKNKDLGRYNLIEIKIYLNTTDNGNNTFNISDDKIIQELPLC